MVGDKEVHNFLKGMSGSECNRMTEVQTCFQHHSPVHQPLYHGDSLHPLTGV